MLTKLSPLTLWNWESSFLQDREQRCHFQLYELSLLNIGSLLMCILIKSRRSWIHEAKPKVPQKWGSGPPVSQGLFPYKGQRPGTAMHGASKNVPDGIREDGAAGLPLGCGFHSAPGCCSVPFCVVCLDEAVFDVIPLASVPTANTENVFTNHNWNTGRFSIIPID